MNGRWRFRVVDHQHKAEYLAQDGKLVEYQGTDVEALAMARQFARGNGRVLRVEAVSVGCPRDITDTPGRLLVFALARYDKRGWTLEGDLMHSSWYGSLEHAVSYTAFRTAGYESETRIVSRTGRVTHVVLIPSDGRSLTLY